MHLKIWVAIVLLILLAILFLGAVRAIAAPPPPPVEVTVWESCEGNLGDIAGVWVMVENHIPWNLYVLIEVPVMDLFYWQQFGAYARGAVFISTHGNSLNGGQVIIGFTTIDWDYPLYFTDNYNPITCPEPEPEPDPEPAPVIPVTGTWAFTSCVLPNTPGLAWGQYYLYGYDLVEVKHEGIIILLPLDQSWSGVHPITNENGETILLFEIVDLYQEVPWNRCQIAE